MQRRITSKKVESSLERYCHFLNLARRAEDENDWATALQSWGQAMQAMQGAQHEGTREYCQKQIQALSWIIVQ